MEYVDLGLACADVCKTLDRGLKGRRADELNKSVLDAIEQLKTCVNSAGVHLIHDLQHLTHLSIMQDYGRDPEKDSKAGQKKRGYPATTYEYEEP
jgi:hypothetical protein